MSLSAVLMGLLYAALTCAIIIFVAWCIVWLFEFFGIGIKPEVLRIGKVIVGLLCIIVIVGFLLSLLGGGTVYRPFRF